MKLPRELLDEIFSHLQAQDDEATLQACSLVAKSWVYPAQKLLFSSVVLNTSTYLLWRKRIRLNKTTLLNHVRSLHYWERDPNPPRWSGPPRIDGLIRYLPSFRQLRTLTLSRMSVESDFSQQVKIFSVFQHTLSSLSIRLVSLPRSAFIALVDFFPNLKNLEICNPHFCEDDQQPTTLSRPLRGGLHIAGFMLEALVTFSDQLLRMQVAYDKLTAENGWIPDSAVRYYQLIINTCGKSLLYLNLHLCERFVQHDSSRISGTGRFRPLIF